MKEMERKKKKTWKRDPTDHNVGLIKPLAVQWGAFNQKFPVEHSCISRNVSAPISIPCPVTGFNHMWWKS